MESDRVDIESVYSDENYDFIDERRITGGGLFSMIGDMITLAFIIIVIFLVVVLIARSCYKPPQIVANSMPEQLVAPPNTGPMVSTRSCARVNTVRPQIIDGTPYDKLVNVPSSYFDAKEKGTQYINWSVNQ